MAKNKYTGIWKPDCEVNTYVTWIELDFAVHQYIDSSLWEDMVRTLFAKEELSLEYLYEIDAVFEGHLECKYS